MSWFKKKVQSYDMAGMALAREMLQAGSLVLEEESDAKISFTDMDGDAALDSLMKQTKEEQQAAVKTLSNSKNFGD